MKYKVNINAPSEIDVADPASISLALSVGLEQIEAVTGPPIGPEPPIIPPVEPPIEPEPPPVSGKIIIVNAGQNLQQAINQAPGGSTLKLDNNGTWVGPFTIPKKEGGLTLCPLVTDVLAPGRIDEATGAKLPSLMTDKDRIPCVIDLGPGADNVTLWGLHIYSNKHVYTIIKAGPDNVTDMAAAPRKSLFKQCWVHGSENQGTRRGITLNGQGQDVIGCLIDHIWAGDADSLAVGSPFGLGDYLIQNNTLISAGQNFMAGGAPGKIPGHVMSNIRIIGNLIKKRLEWRPNNDIRVKNHIEFKRGKNIEIIGNTLQSSWGSQSGASIVLTVRCEQGDNPWNVIENVLVKQNTFKDVGYGINTTGRDSYSNFQGTFKGLVIEDNLICCRPASSSRGIQLLSGVEDVIVRRNTVDVGRGAAAMFFGSVGGPGTPGSPEWVATYPVTNLEVTDNLFVGTTMGSGVGAGQPCVSKYTKNSTFEGDVWDAGQVPSNEQRMPKSDMLNANYTSKIAGKGWSPLVTGYSDPFPDPEPEPPASEPDPAPEPADAPFDPESVPWDK